MNIQIKKEAIEAIKEFLASQQQFVPNGMTAHQYLKTSNIYLQTLTEIISDVEFSHDDYEFDATYDDYNEIIGEATGEKVDTRLPWNKAFQA